MRHYALIGNPLGHSWSQRLFEESVPAGEADYSLCPMPSLDGLRHWVAENGICGFNVTSPYKEAILPLLDEVSPTAREIGAVNCVKVAGGRLHGYNTDAPAFRQTLETAIRQSNIADQADGTPQAIEQSFILGTGGAARAVAYALRQMGIAHTFVSRRPEDREKRNETWRVIGYNELATCDLQSTILINATPVGTWPNVDATPLPHPPASSFTLVYDLIYNPSPTRLMKECAKRGAKATGGLAMLRLQAKLSRDIFFTDITD